MPSWLLACICRRPVSTLHPPLLLLLPKQVPGPEDEGVEQEVKLGKNIPASAEQAVEEAKYVRAWSGGRPARMAGRIGQTILLGHSVLM